ncbi:hypothetical protein M388_14640 [Mesotoga sp. Brook.08.YT.4.2.5.4.]|nr:hypothetical protein M388_14640 [Mesotoga sp. Brook.08.YT.4.2.5.4.]
MCAKKAKKETSSHALDFVTIKSAKSVIAQKLERKNAKLPPRTEAT